jgi:hypothetical protein
MERILIINPGSTSTKIAVFDMKQRSQRTLRHSVEDLARFFLVMEEVDYRKHSLTVPAEKGFELPCLTQHGGGARNRPPSRALPNAGNGGLPVYRQNWSPCFQHRLRDRIEMSKTLGIPYISTIRSR